MFSQKNIKFTFIKEDIVLFWFNLGLYRDGQIEHNGTESYIKINNVRKLNSVIN